MADKPPTEKLHQYQDYLDNYDIDTLFPPFLEEGSHGPAVRVLQVLLLREGFKGSSKNHPLVADGRYGKTTRAGVRWLQRKLGLLRRAVNGQFGPATRVAYFVNCGLDVNDLPFDDNGTDADNYTIFFYRGVEQDIPWPPADGDDWQTPLGYQPSGID